MTENNIKKATISILLKRKSYVLNHFLCELDFIYNSNREKQMMKGIGIFWLQESNFVNIRKRILLS